MTTNTAPSSRSSPSLARRYLPTQHGAWAFLLVPLVLGWTTTPWTPVLVPFSMAWVTAYPASYFTTVLLRGRARTRPVAQTVFWSAVTIALAMLCLGGRPWLVWPGLIWVACFAVSVAFARAGDERSLANDLLLVFQSSSVVPVVALLGLASYDGISPPPPSAVPHAAWILTAASVLWFTGSVLHVKSLIRERRDPRFRTASIAYHVAVLPVAWWLSPWLLLPFSYALARAVAVTPSRKLRPGVIGVVELIGTLLLVAVAFAV